MNPPLTRQGPAGDAEAGPLRVLQRWPWLDTLRTLRLRFREDRLGLTAGSLTFTTLISLVPLLTVMLAVFSAFPLFAQFQQSLQTYFLQSLVPPGIAKPVLAGLTQFASKANRLGTLGLLVLLFTALALMLTIDRTLNGIWRVRKARPLAQRVLVYWAAMTLGPLVLGVSLSLTSYAISASQGLVDVMPGGVSLLLGVLDFGLLACGLAALFKQVPNTPVRWRHALAGGVFASAGIEIAKRGLGWYIGLVPTYSVVYGAFAIVPIFLVWIYLGWVMVLLGAVVTAYAPSLQMRVARWPDGPGAACALGLALIERLAQAHRRGAGGLTALELAGSLGIDPLQTEPVLDVLIDLDWVGRLDEAGEARYVLLCEPATTPAAPLLARLLVAPLPELEPYRRLTQGDRLMLAELLATDPIVGRGPAPAGRAAR